MSDVYDEDDPAVAFDMPDPASIPRASRAAGIGALLPGRTPRVTPEATPVIPEPVDPAGEPLPAEAESPSGSVHGPGHASPSESHGAPALPEVPAQVAGEARVGVQATSVGLASNPQARGGASVGEQSPEQAPDIAEPVPLARPKVPKQPTTLYVSAGVQSRFDKYRRAERRRTNTSVLLEAVSWASKNNIQRVIADSRISPTPGDGLFPEDPAQVRYLGSGSNQIQVSPTYAQLAVLDGITSELGFDTRATWIAPVLNAFLPGRKELRR